MNELFGKTIKGVIEWGEYCEFYFTDDSKLKIYIEEQQGDLDSYFSLAYELS